MLLIVTAGAIFLAPLTLLIGNRLGAAVPKARGVGSISLRQAAAPGTCRVGPLPWSLVAGASQLAGWIRGELREGGAA